MRQALEMALEALETLDDWLLARYPCGLMPKEKEAITSIKEALAQPEQEPVAYVNDQGHEEIEPCPSCGKPLQSALGGGVVCSDRCGYWFCF